MPRINEDKYVEIDADKLKSCIRHNTPMSLGDFALEIGRSQKYIMNMSGKTRIPDYVFNVICKQLGVDQDHLIWKDPDANRDTGGIGIAVVAAINNLSEKIDKSYKQGEQIMKRIGDLEKTIVKTGGQIDVLKESQDAAFRKLNANTIQLERLKEAMQFMSETEYDRAKQFLQDVLSEGRMEGTVLLAKADAACVKRSELMKARKDMGVQIKTVGYGKNQNAWWMKE